MNEIVVSVDPGESSAWCRWINGVVDTYGLLDGTDILPIVRLLVGCSPTPPNMSKVMRGIRIENNATLVIEDQWLGQNYNSANPICLKVYFFFKQRVHSTENTGLKKQFQKKLFIYLTTETLIEYFRLDLFYNFSIIRITFDEH